MKFSAILLRAVAATVLLLTLAGCLGARGDIELVEARLRQQEDLANRYARDLQTVEQERDAARHEAELLRRQIAESGQQAIPSELAQGLFAVKAIEFNALMTGGRDRDGQPGDDVLVAVFVPRDEHGDIVKLPGAIELEAIDLNRPEAERQVGKWTFSAEESRKLWKSGAFSSGYQLEVPLAGQAVAEKVILHAKLSTADGREFAATHTATIRSLQLASSTAAEGAAGAAAAASSPPLAPAAEEPSGKATVTPTAHEETLPVTTDREPRPTTQPLAQEPASPLVPVPSDDAFAPPSDDTRNPFADPPATEQRSASAGIGEPIGTATVRKPAVTPLFGPVEAQPRADAGGELTSDNWTDATIPFLR